MLAFIRLDMVKRLENDGYRSENNWYVDMLEDTELEALLEEKPTLLGERALFELFAGGHLENIVATHKDTLDPLFVYAVTGDTSNLDVIDSPCMEKDGESHFAILLGQGIEDVFDSLIAINAVFETYQACYYGDMNIIEIALDMIDDEACLYDTYNGYLTDKQKDFVEPYYGYCGYDKEAAGNRFVELITEIEISEVA